MTGHFEKGIWIEDAKPPLEPMVVRVKVEVDDNKVQALKAVLQEMQPLLDRIEKVTQDPKDQAEPHLRITVNRAGLGKVYLNDQDISHLTNGFSIRNKAGDGNSVIVNIADPTLDLAVELRQVLFRSDKKLFRLVEVTPE